MKKEITNKKGITLIEMLVVLTIIGILAAVAIPSFLGQRKKAAFSEAKSNLQAIRLLEEQNFAENSVYEPDPAGIAFYTEANQGLQGFLPGFRPGLPQDLNYDYDVTTPDPNGPPGEPSFIAFARPKANTIVAGTAPFWVNDRNENNF